MANPAFNSAAPGPLYADIDEDGGIPGGVGSPTSPGPIYADVDEDGGSTEMGGGYVEIGDVGGADATVVATAVCEATVTKNPG